MNDKGRSKSWKRRKKLRRNMILFDERTKGGQTMKKIGIVPSD